MGDYKAAYSNISKEYIEKDVPHNKMDQDRYNRSKEREKRNNSNWLRQKVNLNEIVRMFIPEDEKQIKMHTEGGVKLNIEGSRYIIKCDKVAGYVRIYDKRNKAYCKYDGTPSRNGDETHFKIKRREDM